ncbi:hypothetical protein V3851_15145 [Paenibacillus sp. M1]|uniref:Uncharacterized protein n=1 Tax=Paenibacillus haidiansis TaxID=1574488 RepID=A0ABU7VW91_9BACL
MKIIKETAILTAFLFIFNLIVKLIFKPDYIIETFEKGVWWGLAVYVTALALMFVIIFLILFVSRFIVKRKNRQKQ